MLEPSLAPQLFEQRAQPLRHALEQQGLFTAHQTAARRWPIGCVALEVTQRCNLDCTLCYLSEHSEAVRDIPLQEVLRRIDRIAQRYGPDTDIQVSGGDPTLRDHDELVQIVAYIRQRGMRASLFTNGILASRELLTRLREAGLSDVAFHVDMTQQRTAYANEAELNTLRLAYIERTRGLGLAVFFNTTVFTGNVQDVPMLARFFAQHSDVVQLASFQMQAETGRGTLGAHDGALTQQHMMQLINEGAGCTLNWDALLGGHPACNRYATALVLHAGPRSRAHDLFFDGSFIARVMRETAGVRVMRGQPWRAAAVWARAVLMRPGLLLAGLHWAARLFWRIRRDWAGLPQARKISYFIHNFMDARQLDQERLDACVFMTATTDGFVPMCEYNARRDAHLLLPIELKDGQLWHPLGDLSPVVAANAQGLAHYPLKYLKGRSRAKAMHERARAKQETT
jgi:7,8-dihydro-6-hydroxymethylpterin dimethyltransferase